MKNIKCLNCGLTNWSASAFCLRCKSSLENSASPNANKKSAEIIFPYNYFTVFKRYPHNLICVGCLCLIICVLGYQLTKSNRVKNIPAENQQSSGVEPVSKYNSTHTPEELGAGNIDKEMIDRDAMARFNSGGVTQGSTIFEVTSKDGFSLPDYRKIEDNANACSNKASSSQIKNISYEKVKDEIIALVEVAVEGYDCLYKTTRTIDNRLTYLWKKNDYGNYHAWTKVSEHYYADRINEYEEAQKVIQEKAKAANKEKVNKLGERQAKLKKEIEEFGK